MVHLARASAILLAATILVWSQLQLSSAQTEEEKLRAAITNLRTTSFELTSNIKLTKNLPPFTLSDSAIRKFRVFSRRGFTISGAKKFRGFWTFRPDPDLPPRPGVELTIDSVNLIDFRAKGPTGVEPAEQLFGFDYYLLGPAIRVAGIVKITNSLIRGNVGRLDGGAIYVTDGSLELKKCNITGNQAERQGGAIGHQPNGQGSLTIEDCSITNNKGTGSTFATRGGAVYLEDFNFGGSNPLTVTFRRTTFKSNSAKNGGAFFAFFPSEGPETPLVIDSCTFDSNSVKGRGEADGGAMYLNYVDTVNFIRPTFKNNLDNRVRNDIYIFWNVPGSTTIRGVSGAGAIITSNEPDRFTIV